MSSGSFFVSSSVYEGDGNRELIWFFRGVFFVCVWVDLGLWA